jgi:hypothetical protein
MLILLMDETHNMTNKTHKQTTRTKKTAPAIKDKTSESEKFAKVSLSASYMAAILADSYTSALLPKAEITDVASALKDRVATIQDGDMKPIEAMLISQAQALQTMFVTLGRMAAIKTSLPQYTAFMNMALKAQSQSRSTIQALIELKFPKQATFVKQANIANGHQQVNNAGITHAKENQNQPNKLLEAQTNEWLDNGKTTTPSGANQAMATVET